MNNKNISKSFLSMLAAGALLFSASAMAGNPTVPPEDVTDEYQRGPDPTESMLEARNGPFSVRTSRVSGLVSGFGGGTIHYPTGTTGTMAAIVVIPGFVSAESSIEWWGPKLASHGFVVMTIDTNTGFDQPPSRARQINNALDYLVDETNTSRSPINGMIDINRLGVVGWSMGGGGTLRVASEGRISAAIPLAPWDTTRFSDVQAPTLIFACESDVIAPVRQHADRFYEQLPSGLSKAFVELNNGTHYCGNGDNRFNDQLSRLGVSWMKLHLDKDQRYLQFVCGPDHERDRNIDEFRSTCP
ncbi:alpha/beta hydrolase [Pseudomonas sp. gcc21]|uniref:alpha/beta hydrolase family protein n=1 Tax=Pseudomonas sp. gcc21 TaxID=2726989 RepID=UPI0014524DDC|nr:dienelactone hydrolase family protein [Pseudomonas sp. gcc21]QJD59054.1 alpha/beta hydrolase [Pseudomonas sp. gcc21]